MRGICPAGHIVETRAPARRITWRGPCPHQDEGAPRECGLYVIAQRIPEPPATDGPLETPPAPHRGGAVRKVSTYVDSGIDPARPDEPGFAEPSPSEPDGGGDPGVSDPSAPAGPDRGPAGPGGHHHPADGRRRSRRTLRDFLTGPTIENNDEWTIPGIYE